MWATLFLALSTYPQALRQIKKLTRRLIIQGLVRALVVVKHGQFPICVLAFCDGDIGFEINLFVFQAAPQALAEDVVETAAFAVHADTNALS